MSIDDDNDLYSTTTTVPMPSSLTQLDRLCDKRPSLYTQVILLDDATSVHENLSYKLRLRHIRATVYNFLERPRGTLSFIYHVVIFMYIVLVHSLSALADSPDHAEWTVTTTHNMEYSLAVYFTAEFLVRLWAIGADAKYAGWKGFLKYMCRFISIVDVLILNVTFFVVFSYHSTFSLAAIEKIRFLQILRLLHIDRQMTTWKMIQEMISRSFEELATVYWLSGLLFLLMAYSAFELEGWAEANAKARNITMEPTFRHYGDAFWFGIVSVLTIGYGDIVPRHWLSKLVLSVLCIFGVILFTAASALVGVGMSLMVENETKQQQQTKVRNLAATLIQTWYRFHLISNRDKFAGIPQFRKFCNNLHYVEERFRTARSLAKQSALRKASKRFSQPFKRQTSLPERDGPNEDSNPNDYHAVVTLLNSAPVIGGLMPDYDLNEGARFRAMGANERPSLPSELPPKPPSWRSSSLQSRVLQGMHSVSSSHSMLAKSIILQNASSCESSNPSVDFSDEEKLLDYYYDPYKTNSTSSLNERKSVDTMISALDDGAISRYRQILRMLYFFMFSMTMKKFHRARKPYELLDAESELCEMEHQRMQKLKELELRVQATVGKPTISPFQNDDDAESGAVERLNIEDRLILCEDALRRLETKARLINDLANSIMSNFQTPRRKSTQLLRPPTTLREAQKHVQKDSPQGPPRRVLFKQYQTKDFDQL